MRISTNDAQAEKVRNPREKKNVKTEKEPIKTKSESHKIDPNPSNGRAMHEGDNPSFFR
jgi:hypothetical protein